MSLRDLGSDGNSELIGGYYNIEFDGFLITWYKQFKDGGGGGNRTRILSAFLQRIYRYRFNLISESAGDEPGHSRLLTHGSKIRRKLRGSQNALCLKSAITSAIRCHWAIVTALIKQRGAFLRRCHLCFFEGVLTSNLHTRPAARQSNQESNPEHPHYILYFIRIFFVCCCMLYV